MVQRNMQLQCNIQDGEIYLNDDAISVDVKISQYEVA